MLTRSVAAVASFLLSGAAHSATITEIVISGQGVVTLSIPGTVDGNPISPEVGTPVSIVGRAFFDSGVVPSGASGRFVCCGNAGISRIEVSFSTLGSFASFDEYNGSRVELTDGKVSQFVLGASYGGSNPGGYISDTDFQFEKEITPICDASGYCLTSSFVLGSWMVSSIDVRTDAVPEPAQWMLMLLGFGLAGGRLRHRRSYAQVPPYATAG